MIFRRGENRVTIKAIHNYADEILNQKDIGMDCIDIINGYVNDLELFDEHKKRFNSTLRRIKYVNKSFSNNPALLNLVCELYMYERNCYN